MCPCCFVGVEEKERRAASRGNWREVRDAIENATALYGRVDGAKCEAVRRVGTRDRERARRRALGVAMTMCVAQGRRGSRTVEGFRRYDGSMLDARRKCKRQNRQLYNVLDVDAVSGK